jgi:hypothetical protein
VFAQVDGAGDPRIGLGIELGDLGYVSAREHGATDIVKHFGGKAP